MLFLNWDSLHARLNRHYKVWSYKIQMNSSEFKLLVNLETTTFLDTFCRRKTACAISS